MAHNSTVLGQFLALVSRHEFEEEAGRHHRGRKLRSMSRWSQFLALATAQLSGRCSLRDIVSNLDAQARKLYHLGVRRVARSSLARVNEQQPWELYEALFGRLLSRCRKTAPGHGFRFGNKLLSLDATYVSVCLEVFPWARYRERKGAVKLRVGLDHAGLLPSFLRVTDGKGSDLEVARSLRLPQGSIVAADRLYVDFERLTSLDSQGVFLVTRLKKGIQYAVRERRSFARGRGVTSDQTIVLTSEKGRQRCPISTAPGRLPGPANRPVLRVPDQQLQPRSRDHRRHLQGALADRTLLQVDQAEPAYQELRRHFPQCGPDPDLGRDVRPSLARLPEVRQQDVLDHEPDPATSSTQSLRSKIPGGPVQTTGPRPDAAELDHATRTMLKFVGQQCVATIQQP